MQTTEGYYYMWCDYTVTGMKTHRQPNWFDKVIVDFKKLTEMYMDMEWNTDPFLKSLGSYQNEL